MRRSSNGHPVVTVLGVTFKENVPDIRNTRVVDIVRELEDFGITVQLHDPMADGDLLQEEYGLTLTPLDKLQPADAVVLAVAHRALPRGRLGPGEAPAEAGRRLRRRRARPARPLLHPNRRHALASLTSQTSRLAKVPTTHQTRSFGFTLKVASPSVAHSWRFGLRALTR